MDNNPSIPKKILGKRKSFFLSLYLFPLPPVPVLSAPFLSLVSACLIASGSGSVSPQRWHEISISEAIETKRYLFHIRHETPRRIQWRGDVMLPPRMCFSIVDKSPRLTLTDIANKTQNRFPLTWNRNEILRAYGRFRHSKCSHEKLSGQSGEYSRWNTVRIDQGNDRRLKMLWNI